MTKPSILTCLLAWGRQDLTDRWLKDIYPLAGVKSTLKVICREGIAEAINEGFRAGLDGKYSHVMLCANDIWERQDWLKNRLHYANITPRAIMSVDLVSVHRKLKECHIIGNWLIPIEVIQTIGAMTTKFGPYGPIDLDYQHRATFRGFRTFYIPHQEATHNGSDDEAYGYSKEQRVRESWAQHARDFELYRTGKVSTFIHL